jgi:hypothetical protein
MGMELVLELFTPVILTLWSSDGADRDVLPNMPASV